MYPCYKPFWGKKWRHEHSPGQKNRSWNTEGVEDQESLMDGGLPAPNNLEICWTRALGSDPFM